MNHPEGVRLHKGARSQRPTLRVRINARAIDPKTGDVKICFKETGLKKESKVSYVAKGMVTAS
ncbi:hypothetical protein [Massilia rubra]|uniref:50S ribosomal protein L24 n=1 Tax=Massilia rubra TaxID=2607910 RepID=A0ABX0LQ81_9BURK|nr:hypothetical protein [Massilia rubra]NHZ34057.1 hypothetical protein [Massilia rubra]